MEIVFYEKHGCINNTKQKQLLESHGHKVIAHSLLLQEWTPEILRPFFGNMPVSKWFNTAAPRVKSGELNPNKFDEQSALDAMVVDPLLIRRPLIKMGENRVSGFDNDLVNSLLNNEDLSHLQACPNLNNACK